jgi:membrane protein DedA with SNARE-associated domain
MDAILNYLLTFALLYRYAAIFLILFLGSIALPVPSGAVLVAAFLFATQGYLSFWPVAATGLVANLLGDILLFWLARARGEKLLRRIGLGRLLDSSAMRKIETGIAKHPILTVFFSRFTTTITPLANALAGLAKMAFLTFLIVDVIGQAAEVGLNYAYALFFGSNWIAFGSISTKFGILTAAVVALVIVVWWRHHWKRSHHAQPIPKTTTP